MDIRANRLRLDWTNHGPQAAPFYSLAPALGKRGRSGVFGGPAALRRAGLSCGRVERPIDQVEFVPITWRAKAG
jgi:hypothetical protein